MTTKVTVSVNGNYKIPVKQGEVTTIVSGRGHEGPKSVDFWPHSHGDGTVFVIGPEKPDNGDVTAQADSGDNSPPPPHP